MSKTAETIKLLRTMDIDQLIELFQDLNDAELISSIQEAAAIVVHHMEEKEQINPDQEHIIADNRERYNDIKSFNTRPY